MTDIAFRSACDLITAIRKRELSSRELLEHYLKRVERYNPQLNAVVTLDVERARKRADAADAALARGEVFGPLHGLPVTIKDTIETAGIRTTAGAPVHAEHVPAQDAPAVARLVAAGAVIFGKTNTPVFAMDAQSYNPLFGVTNNPWDLTRSPGGSSGGAAAALAAGLTGLELGSDIGGSIRNPVHYCGVYGHKPSFDIIPLRGHIPGPPGSLSGADIAVLGPLGRGAEDLALALEVMAGPDTEEAVAWKLALLPPRRSSLREYRIAAWLDEPACPTDAGVKDRFQSAVETLRRAGAQVNEEARPAFQFADALRAYWRLLWAATSPGLPPDQFQNFVEMAGQLPQNDDSDLARFAHAATQRHRDWLSANEARAHYRVRWAEFFKDYDVLLCPITTTAAIPHDHSEPMLARTIRVNGQPRSYLDQIAWAGVIGMAYLPATIAPVGRTSEGLPVGIQIVGPYLEDRTPIDFARRLAEVVGGFAVPPGYE
ncbi:MAG TPA: amidase [Candidatus Binatia bacterium]|nr:amidase [Candidatus Binatia bacterium]